MFVRSARWRAAQGTANDKGIGRPLASDGTEGDMLRAGSRTAINASVWGIISILAMLAATPADARRHATAHKGHGARAHTSHHSSRGGYSPPYSAIVVDANSGATLHESSPDGLRHPASLTKIMTLYLLFEQLNAGKLTLEIKDRSFRARRVAIADKARRPGWRHDRGRGCHQSHRDTLRQRYRLRDRREDRRR